MHYLARMDVFLGSHSNMYPVVVARRIALNVNRENRFRRHSCVLLTSHAHSAYTPPTVHCEGKTRCLRACNLVAWLQFRILFAAVLVFLVSFDVDMAQYQLRRVGF
jgi:hypothetical protein